MNIVYSSSDSYALVAGISMYSLLVNHQDVDELHIFCIDNRISTDNKKKLTQTCSDFGRRLEFIPMTDIEAIVGHSIDIGRWNISTFARLFYGSLLPSDVDKVLHIDCDTMILSSLQPLWDMDMGEAIVAGTLEAIGDNYKKEIGLKPADVYLQAGNIMLNLAKIREKRVEDRFKEYMGNAEHLSFVDQAVLNACLSNQEKMVVDFRYNLYSLAFYLTYPNMRRARRISHYYTEQEVCDAVKNPCVVHFTTCFMDGTRPWMEKNRHPLLPVYLEYKKNSKWTESPLWKDQRSVFRKVLIRMCRILPQRMVAEMVGFVHNVVLPMLHRLT